MFCFMLKAVAFDMDGLMFDTESVYWKAASALLERRGEKYTDELSREIMGRPPEYCFRHFKQTFALPETWQELQKESEDLFLAFLQEGYSTMPGLFELLEFLESRQIPKGICTSSASRVVSEVLRGYQLERRFQFVLTSESIKRGGKPDPEIYLLAAEHFNLEPHEMLVLEDSVAGIRSADAAGAFPVLLMSSHNKVGDFSLARKCVHRLDDIEILSMF
ncbi:MAG: HAD family hydrolase [Thermoguttaceae bacterium]